MGKTGPGNAPHRLTMVAHTQTHTDTHRHTHTHTDTHTDTHTHTHTHTQTHSHTVRCRHTRALTHSRLFPYKKLERSHIFSLPVARWAGVTCVGLALVLLTHGSFSSRRRRPKSRGLPAVFLGSSAAISVVGSAGRRCRTRLVSVCVCGRLSASIPVLQRSLPIAYDDPQRGPTKTVHQQQLGSWQVGCGEV